MKATDKSTAMQGIVYSECDTPECEGDPFISDHGFCCILSGTLTVSDGISTRTFQAGDCLFYPKDHLARFIRRPAKSVNFSSITIVLDYETLMSFSQEHGYTMHEKPANRAVVLLAPDTLLRSYLDLLLLYLKTDVQEPLMQLKKKEAVMLLLHEYPELKNVLFDFTAPVKTDLEAFMEQNYKYNVELKQFAYLTGRSLATFKRDFKKIFNTSPNRWLQQKRLEEAYQLIKEKRQMPSRVYIDVGFESLSHFSHSFKGFFGLNPSTL